MQRRPKKTTLVKILTNRAEISLTQGRVALVDIEDIDKVRDKTWHVSNGYAQHSYVDSDSKKIVGIWMHRLVMGCPVGLVDHINNNRLDNRKINLRISDHSTNARNRKSAPAGYCWYESKNRWLAYVMVDGKHIRRTFKTEDEAKAWRLSAEKEHYGEFAAKRGECLPGQT